MINTIVTGVDDSETAASAAKIAAELATTFEAELHVITAYGNKESQTLRAGGDELHINHKDTASHIAKNVADSLRADFPHLTITSNSARGQAGEALVSAASELGADLIVVGNKRVQGFTRVLGSVARSVASQARCDVYIAYTQ